MYELSTRHRVGELPFRSAPNSFQHFHADRRWRPSGSRSTAMADATFDCRWQHLQRYQQYLLDHHRCQNPPQNLFVVRTTIVANSASVVSSGESVASCCCRARVLRQMCMVRHSAEPAMVKSQESQHSHCAMVGGRAGWISTRPMCDTGDHVGHQQQHHFRRY